MASTDPGNDKARIERALMSIPTSDGREFGIRWPRLPPGLPGEALGSVTSFRHLLATFARFRHPVATFANLAKPLSELKFFDEEIRVSRTSRAVCKGSPTRRLT